MSKYKTVPLIARQILIVLGGFDLEKKYEAGRETIPPVKIHIHPDWNHQSVSYDGDIALLELERKIYFNDYIQPICLWESNIDPIASSGVIVGYGRSEDSTKKHENTPKSITVPIHTQENCFLTQPGLAKISSTRTFCAGAADGNGVCSGDSGGGILVNINSVFYLRGIVSSSLVMNGLCDLNSYAVFTNVLKYKDWITSQGKLSSPVVNNDRVFFPSNEGYQSFNGCGMMSSSVGLIQKGVYSSRKEFPWMVSLVDKTSTYRTNGVLVSNKHVVCRGSVVGTYDKETNTYSPIALSKLKIVLGALKHEEANALTIEPKEYSLHPHLKQVDNSAINSVAVITLERSVQFSDIIKPICLWPYNDDLSLIAKSQFYFVGNGIDETGKYSNVRKYARGQLVDENECKTGYSGFENVFKQAKHFCVRGDQNGNPCELDEFVFVKFYGRWYLRGIMQRYMNFPNKTCKPNAPYLFEDMAQHSKWIQTQIEF